MAIRYSILGLLHYKDMHGYQIKKHIEGNFGHMWTVNYGQIYPNLKSLLDDGLVTMKEESNGGKGPSRKRYSITDKGRQAFTDWLAESPERPMLLRDPFLMRFVFFGFGDPDRAVALLDEQIEHWEKQLQQREKNMARWRSHDVYVRMMAELGISQNRMFLEWLHQARQEILADAQSHEPEAVSAKS